MMKYVINIKMMLVIVLLITTSCSKDYLDPEYTTGISEEDLKVVIGNEPEKLKGLINGMYLFMVEYQSGGAHDSFNFTAMLHATDMMGQDISQPTSHYFSWDYLHQYRSAPLVRTAYIWNTFYTLIANSNRTIELMELLDSDSDFYKGCLGEIMAIRGFSYLYLIQLYQDVYYRGSLNLQAPGVPIYLSTLDGIPEDEQNILKGRNTVERVFQQIESDLTMALELLQNYDRAGDKRSVNMDVVNGMLARYYLLTENWDKAAYCAHLAYQSYDLMDSVALKSGFKDLSNSEWMWGFDHTVETETSLVSWFSHISNNSPGYAGILSPRLIDYNLYESIPDEDIRKQLFNGPEGLSPEDYIRFQPFFETAPNIQEAYASLKFGWSDNWTQDYPYMRASEMILIEAEAYAHNQNYAMAAEVLRPLMEMRQPGWDMNEVELEYIYLQRRIELWGEGFSYFDLKRLERGINRAYTNSNHSISGQIEVEASSDNWVFQIPRREIQDNIYIQENEQND